MNPLRKADLIRSESLRFVGGANDARADGEQGAATALALFLANVRPGFLPAVAKLGELICSLAVTMHSENRSSRAVG
jgi:hypothetical protein